MDHVPFLLLRLLGQEMYGPLLYGGKLVLVPSLLPRIRCSSAEAAGRAGDHDSEPGTYVFLSAVARGAGCSAAKAEGTPSDLRRRGPESQLLKEWRAAYPNTQLINMYGITETTVTLRIRNYRSRD